MAVPRDQAGVRRQVAAGYDHMADRYTQARSPVLPPLLEAFAEGLDDGAAALDLGCGAGVPISAWLARRFAVTGIDASARQIALARERVPLADFRQADMTVARFPTARFALIVAAYSIIHVPREEHSSLIHRIASWLAPGGGFLASWALDAWEGEEQDWEGWGAAMWWSHFGAETSLTMLRDAGLTVNNGDIATVSNGPETWMWVLARTPAHGAGRRSER